MMRASYRWLALLVTVTLLVTVSLAGCAGEGPSVRDGGGTYPPPSDDQGVPRYDTGTQPPPGASTCAQILQCVQGCGDDTCTQACVAAGSDDGKTKMATLDACLQGAIAGTCATQCGGNIQSTACQDCVGVACKAELDTCMRGAGAGSAFGEACDVASPACADGLACLAIEGASAGRGVCTKKCPTLGDPCDGEPEGTEAACLLSAQASNFCAFVCTLPDHNFPCPQSTVCATADNPPGSGQRICLP